MVAGKGMIISYKFSMGRLNVFPISHLFPVWFSYGSQRYDVLLQVNELVTVTWVKPRILDPVRIDLMRERMDAWASQTGLLLEHLEQVTPELLVS